MKNLTIMSTLVLPCLQQGSWRGKFFLHSFLFLSFKFLFKCTIWNFYVEWKCQAVKCNTVTRLKPFSPSVATLKENLANKRSRASASQMERRTLMRVVWMEGRRECQKPLHKHCPIDLGQWQVTGQCVYGQSEEI